MAASALSATMAVGSAYDESVSLGIQAAQEKKQAGVQARLDEIRADQAKKKGDSDAKTLQDKAAKLIGSQKAAAAASGVVVDYGSSEEMQQEADLLSSIDVEKIKNNAMLEAWGYKVSGQNKILQGEFDSMALKNKATSTLLTGLGKGAVSGIDGYGKLPKDNSSKINFDKSMTLDARNNTDRSNIA